MLANFATSEHGKLYGRVCERYGLDPAAHLDDDVMAYNLRVALLTAEADQRAAENAEPVELPGGGIRYDGGVH